MLDTSDQSCDEEREDRCQISCKQVWEGRNTGDCVDEDDEKEKLVNEIIKKTSLTMCHCDIMHLILKEPTGTGHLLITSKTKNMLTLLLITFHSIFTMTDKVKMKVKQCYKNICDYKCLQISGSESQTSLTLT